jgi:hypothetical protein
MNPMLTAILSAKAVQSGLIVTCIMIMSPSTLQSRELTGIVYSHHCGPSGTGTCEVQLSTKTGLVHFAYQKPIKLDSSDDRCWEVGAIWTVETERRTGELVRVHCVGKLDTDVHSAWMAVRNYIKAVAKAAGEELGYQPNRRGPVNAKMGEVEIDLSGYLNFGSTGMCLEMKQHIDNNTILIESSADCYFIPDIDFRVEQIRPTAWEVTSVKAVPPRK